MEILKIASFALIFLVCVKAHPIKLKEDRLCDLGDDYYNSNSEDIEEVLNVLRSMLQILSIRIDDVKEFFIKTFLYEEDICDYHIEYAFSLTTESNDSSENSGETEHTQKLAGLYTVLIKMYNLVEEMRKEYEISMNDQFWELVFNPECGLAGMICFSEPYVPLEVRQEVNIASSTLSSAGDKVDHLCKDLSIIESLRASTSTWLAII